jgi:uncharacterized OB-fold protein
MAAPFPQPAISPSPDALAFWDAAKRHELALPYCLVCQRYFFYPRSLCPSCGSRDLQWRRATGRGTLYTFCIQHQSALPGFREATPFVTAIVTLDEGPRLMALLVDVVPTPDAIHCDMPVEVAFVGNVDGQSLPVFRPVRPSG